MEEHYFQYPKVQYVIDAVYAYARALAKYKNDDGSSQSILRNSPSEHFVKNYLVKEVDAKKNYSIFNYNIKGNGKTGYDVIAEWDINDRDKNIYINQASTTDG